jgi:hypothetical protein
MWHATSSLVRQNPKVINAFLEKARKIAAGERKRFKPAAHFPTLPRYKSRLLSQLFMLPVIESYID